MPHNKFTAELWMSPDALLSGTLSKRNEDRHRVLLRANIHVVQLQSDVIVTDISRSGLRGKTEADLGVGQAAYISLDGLTQVAGSIKWVRDGRFGMKFSKLLDVVPECADVEPDCLANHDERMPLVTPFLARITISTWASAACVRNVSKSGMLVEGVIKVTPQQKLFISLTDGRTFEATVKWVDGNKVGIQLATPVSILQLAH